MTSQKIFLQLYNDGKTGDYSKISDSHISFKDYLTCEKIRDKFEMKNMGEYHDQYLKKMNCNKLMFLKSLLAHV